MTALRVASTNQKGGSGKTTTALNTAGALANRGNRVLLIDLDPQGHATEGVSLEASYDDPDRRHLLNVLPDLDAIDRLEELVCEHDEFDVVPSHQAMINAEDALSGVPNRESRLKLALDELEATYEYDVIVVDCPPNLGVLTDNALLACENIVIPAEAKTTSVRAIELLFQQVNALERAFGIEIRELALVANEVGNDGEAEEMMEWFDEVFAERAPVYEIRKRVSLQRAWNNGVSIFEHTEECDMEAEYLALATHLEEAM